MLVVVVEKNVEYFDHPPKRRDTMSFICLRSNFSDPPLSVTLWRSGRFDIAVKSKREIDGLVCPCRLAVRGQQNVFFWECCWPVLFQQKNSVGSDYFPCRTHKTVAYPSMIRLPIVISFTSHTVAAKGCIQLGVNMFPRRLTWDYSWQNDMWYLVNDALGAPMTHVFEKAHHRHLAFPAWDRQFDTFQIEN